MENTKNIDSLQIYLLSKELSNKSRDLYSSRDYDIKKIIWSQFIRSVDSIWANIAEWYGRFHYLDSIKFYYNARWSLLESKYWLDLLLNRNLISGDIYKSIEKELDTLLKKLNAFIKSIKSQIK